MDRRRRQALEREGVDRLIRLLWGAYAKLCDDEIPGESLMTDEDVELWGKVTRHPAVQRRLRNG